jgi:hypothetical protein
VVTVGDVSTEVPPGPATVTTDPGGVGATPAVPIQTSVRFTAPSGDPTPVSIDLHAPTVGAPSGYTILGNEVEIDLDGVTQQASSPIVIEFTIDASTGVTPETVTMSRTNDDGTTDVAATCVALPTAVPDPCFVAAYVAGPGSDVRVTVYTTHASKWLALRRTDTTPPAIAPTVTGTPGLSGWYRSNVGVSWRTTDPDSAIITSTGCGPSTVASDTAGVTLTCSATSAGGTTSKSVVIKRDATPPTLTCNAATFIVGARNARVTAAVADATSGPLLPSTLAIVDTSTVGRKTATLVGLDRAGNPKATGCDYVVGYALTNLKPTSGASVKRGSTVVVEFRLRDAGDRLVSDSTGRAIATTCGAKILFSGGLPSSNCARYDASRDTFLFDLKTANTLAPGPYVVTVQVLSGSQVVTSATVTIDVRK